ncbi:hypothetical protein AALC75_21110 [Lachnospiraceae bacterium 48-42]
MRKRMSRILSILMASVLVVSAGSVVRAEEFNEPEAQETAQETVQAAETGIEAEPAEAEPVEAEPAADAEVTEEGTQEEVTGEETDAALPENAEEVLAQKEESKLESASEAEEVLDTEGVRELLAGGAAVVKQNDIVVNHVSTYKQLENFDKNPEQMVICTIIRDLDDTFVSFGKSVSLPKGTIELAVSNNQQSGCSVEFGVYTDAQMNNRISSYGYSTQGDTRSIICNIPKDGSYYIGVKPSTSIPERQYYAVALIACSYSGQDRAIKNKERLVIGQKDGGTVNYVKYKATQTGYLKTSTDTSSKMVKITLCDKSKKSLSGESLASEEPTYGVKKGKTYWIKLKNPWSSSAGYYTFTLNNGKVKESKAGKSQKKAVTIKKNKNIKGWIEAGKKEGKQADWYKFNLTGKKSVKIYMKGGTNDKINVTVYEKIGSRTRKIGTRTVNNNFNNIIPSRGKWSKGTYWIKISRGTAKSSGYYTLKWK